MYILIQGQQELGLLAWKDPLVRSIFLLRVRSECTGTESVTCSNAVPKINREEVSALSPSSVSSMMPARYARRRVYRPTVCLLQASFVWWRVFLSYALISFLLCDEEFFLSYALISFLLCDEEFSEVMLLFHFYCAMKSFLKLCSYFISIVRWRVFLSYALISFLLCDEEFLKLCSYFISIVWWRVFLSYALISFLLCDEEFS